jgi:hypothetical protein
VKSALNLKGETKLGRDLATVGFNKKTPPNQVRAVLPSDITKSFPQERQIGMWRERNSEEVQM